MKVKELIACLKNCDKDAEVHFVATADGSRHGMPRDEPLRTVITTVVREHDALGEVRGEYRRPSSPGTARTKVVIG